MVPMKLHKKARSAGGGSSSILTNDYQGHILSPGGKLSKARFCDLSPERFFRKFVAAREPVLIVGCLPASEGWQGAKWTNQYLRDKAGDSEVKVEFREAVAERFGQGRERAMKFGDFLGELERRNDLLYLTTQELGVDPAGRPRMMSAPLDRLRDDFPLRPRLMGGMVPHNMNLWMGYSREGSSSGLHHDFHDNLYLLLRGRKKFRLFSPADAHRMYVEGEIVKVHPNGRINYRGQETLADGSDLLSEAAARAAGLVDRAAVEAEKIASKLSNSCSVSADGASGHFRQKKAADSTQPEEEVQRHDPGKDEATEQLEAAEEEVEKALEAVLDAECAGGGGFGDCDSDESSDSEGGPGFFGGIRDNPSEEFAAASSGRSGTHLHEQEAHRRGLVGGPAESLPWDAGGQETVRPNLVDSRRTKAGDALDSELGNGRVRTAAANGSNDGEDAMKSTKKLNNSEGHAGGRAAKRKGVTDGEEAGEKPPPSNFSKVDPALPRAELVERFPLFLEAESCTVEVEAGQMLFLPAGWFHEVSSVASEDSHMAFNYWFHPPDAGIGNDDDICDPSAPYKSTFWQRDWETREREYNGP